MLGLNNATAMDTDTTLKLFFFFFFLFLIRYVKSIYIIFEIITMTHSHTELVKCFGISEHEKLAYFRKNAKPYSLIV